MRINRTMIKTCLQLLSLLIAVAFIASCAATAPDIAEKSPPVVEEGSPPSEHVWQYLYSYGNENHGYATYSYVLVGRDESNQNAASLYFKLVRAITGSTAEADSLSNHLPANKLNLFLIPAIKRGGGVSPGPNYKLSKSLLTVLSASSPTKFDRPGPYIITLYRPISGSKQDDVADVLYIDLTNLHPTAIPELVSTYKRKILEENLRGIEKLNSLKLSILNILLITEDSIGFARTAYAELRNAFFE